MAKFHINSETGDPGKCSAKVRCPFGDMEKDHYESKGEARAAFEEATKTAALKVWKKKIHVAPAPVNRTLELSKGTWSAGRHGGHGTFTPDAPTLPVPKSVKARPDTSVRGSYTAPNYNTPAPVASGSTKRRPVRVTPTPTIPAPVISRPSFGGHGGHGNR